MSYTTGAELCGKKKLLKNIPLKDALAREYLVNPIIHIHNGRKRLIGGIVRFPHCMVGRVVKVREVRDREISKKPEKSEKSKDL